MTLFQRIAAAFLVSDALLHEREPLIAAAQTAESFEQLPADMQRLLLRLEKRNTGEGAMPTP